MKDWCGNCFKIRIDIEYDERIILRNDKSISQWRNLRYTTYELGDQVPCTGHEIDELAAAGEWRVWSPPWRPSGEEPGPEITFVRGIMWIGPVPPEPETGPALGAGEYALAAPSMGGRRMPAPITAPPVIPETGPALGAGEYSLAAPNAK